ncbi:MAG TPA: IclR family transcriptional regulator [Mycobacteriales bacterium]|nr:IclR family transcriptional regulator [Mycobacteriales bacterium]
MEERPGTVQSVERAFRLLELLADSGGQRTLRELSSSSGLAPATTHRLLHTLAARGYVRQVEGRRYALGAALLVLGNATSRLLAALAQPYLAEIADLSGETTNLAIMEDDHVVYVAQAAGRHRMRMFTEVGRRVLPHSTAVGKVLMAWKPEDEVRRVTERFGLPQRTAHTHTQADTFIRELGRVRQRGYALDDEEEEEGVRCVAVPVGPGPTAVMALSVSAPATRMPRHDHALIAQMTRTGERLRAALDDQEDTGSAL